MITLARIYCKNNYRYWIVKYQNERTGNDYPYTYTDKDYDLFPRYLVLAYLLKKIDLLVGRKFKTFTGCVSELLNAASYPDNEPNDKIKLTKEDEKRNYREFILSLNQNEVANLAVKRLSYRKKLGKHESEKIRKRLLEKWNYSGYWYPIDGNYRDDALFLPEKYIAPFEKEITAIIQSISLKRFYAIDECGDDYRNSISDFTLSLYDGSEKFCCDNTFDWVVYGSHESTISFGGEKLIPQIKELLKDYESIFNIWEDLHVSDKISTDN